jgi:hypothetical protein
MNAGSKQRYGDPLAGCNPVCASPLIGMVWGETTFDECVATLRAAIQ